LRFLKKSPVEDSRSDVRKVQTGALHEVLLLEMRLLKMSSMLAFSRSAEH
jgi:hypothetical protein